MNITLVEAMNPMKDKVRVFVKRVPMRGEAITLNGITYKIINYNTVIDTEQETEDLVALVEIVE